MSQDPPRPLFPDKSESPQDEDVASILGRVQRYWDQLVADALAKARFAFSLAPGEAAYAAALAAELPEGLRDEILRAPKYPEGRRIRIEVATAADGKIARRLLAIKLEH